MTASPALAAPEIDRSLLTRVFALINGKGGVGKTTLTANIAGMAAKSGSRVLTVDLDPQGNLGLDLGYQGSDDDDNGNSLAQAMLFGAPVNVVKDVRPGLDCIVGGDGLHHVQASLAAGFKNGTDPRLVLARVLAGIAEGYDLILIDCPPGGDALQNAAIAASRWAITPVRVDRAGAQGLSKVAARLAAVLDVNPDLELLGVVLFDIEKSATVVDASTRANVVEQLGTGGEDLIFRTAVRHSSKVAQQARDFGKLVHELEEYANAQPQWWQLLREGKSQGAELVTRTATNVAEDLHAIAVEMFERLNAAEAQEENR